jgi:hypothetical protein
MRRRLPEAAQVGQGVIAAPEPELGDVTLLDGAGETVTLRRHVSASAELAPGSCGTSPGSVDR